MTKCVRALFCSSMLRGRIVLTGREASLWKGQTEPGALFAGLSAHRNERFIALYWVPSPELEQSLRKSLQRDLSNRLLTRLWDFAVS